MAITVSPDHLAARGISHTVATPTSSLMKKSTATYGIIDHLAEQQPLLGDLIQPYAARIMSAIRKSPSPLTAIMRPISTARCSLAKATSICQRIHGHLRWIPSRRDALSSDDISSATPQHQGAPQAAHAFAAAAAAKPPSIEGMHDAADARDDAKISKKYAGGGFGLDLAPISSSRPTPQLEAMRRLYQGHWGGFPAMCRDGGFVILGPR